MGSSIVGRIILGSLRKYQMTISVHLKQGPPPLFLLETFRCLLVRYLQQPGVTEGSGMLGSALCVGWHNV